MDCYKKLTLLDEACRLLLGEALGLTRHLSLPVSAA